MSTDHTILWRWVARDGHKTHFALLTEDAAGLVYLTPKATSSNLEPPRAITRCGIGSRVDHPHRWPRPGDDPCKPCLNLYAADMGLSDLDPADIEGRP